MDTEYTQGVHMAGREVPPRFIELIGVEYLDVRPRPRPPRREGEHSQYFSISGFSAWVWCYVVVG